jgi:alpha-tubulin suppressor-like RCC1 family protein
MSANTFANISADEQQDSRSGHTCGVATDGSLSCWGSGSWGMLGDGADGQGLPPHLTTVPVVVGTGHFVDVAVGAKDSCALDASGAAYCAGDNFWKQLGVDTTASVCTEPQSPSYSASCSTTFVRVSGTTTFRRIFAGGYTTCGVTSTGDAYCWGMNLAAQANSGLPPTNATPALASTSVSFNLMSGGLSHMCGLTATGVAYCWGRGGFGELGTGAQIAQEAPTAVASALTFTRISAGGSHACAVATSGDVYCWGTNTNFELGSPTSESCNGNSSYSVTCSTTPIAVAGLPKAVDVAVGAQHSCALAVSGAVYCWGDGTRGQLGQGSTTSSVAPVRVKDTK